MAKDSMNYNKMKIDELIKEVENRGIRVKSHRRQDLINSLTSYDAVHTSYQVEYLGVSVTIDGEVLDDFNFLKSIRDMEDNQTHLVDTVEILLGDQFEDTMCALADENGRLPMERITGLFDAIFDTVGEKLKN